MRDPLDGRHTKELDMNTLELDGQLNKLIIQRKSQEAFLTFYAEECHRSGKRRA
jgi:hypothetical protein